MSEITVEPYYQRQAKDLTTTLFDKGFLNAELSRDAIDWLEDYMGFVIQSSAQSAAKCAVLTAKLRERVV
jgi:hypothetical protein